MKSCTRNCFIGNPTAIIRGNCCSNLWVNCWSYFWDNCWAHLWGNCWDYLWGDCWGDRQGGCWGHCLSDYQNLCWSIIRAIIKFTLLEPPLPVPIEQQSKWQKLYTNAYTYDACMHSYQWQRDALFNLTSPNFESLTKFTIS